MVDHKHKQGHNGGLILYGLRFATKKIFGFKYKISLVENQSYGYKMDGKSVRLSTMNQAPSTQEETKNCSTSNCGLPNIPYFQKSRNPVPNSLISPINSTDCAANSTSNGNASGDSSQAAVPGHL
uniref:Uncharacterized protein n=1 Tax=Populus davidiana TaxID=266767 RepID=A0A6M2EBA6_9ROSI